MKVKDKETGVVRDATQWYPGVEHPDVLRENPPTRGHPQGSGVLRGGRTVSPGEWIVCEDDEDRLLVVILPDGRWDDYDYEVFITDETAASAPKKACPLLNEDCREDGCAWWSDDAVCVVFKKLLE